jgi:septum formation topological specificity factor MinE
MRLEEGINKSEEKNSKKNTYSDLTNLTKNDIVAVIEQFSEQERDWILEELVRGKRIQEMKELSITTPKLENSNFRLSNSITKNWIKKEEI